MIKKGFTLVEVMLGIALAGLLLVMLCGVFVYGLNAIEKGRIRSTAINLVERKISEAHNMVKRAGSDDSLTYEELLENISDSEEIFYNGVLLSGGEDCNLWVVDPSIDNTIEARGTISIKDTADFDYIFVFEDSSWPDVKEVSVGLYWEDEERVGIKKVYLESLVSKFQ